jgi:DNA mismatch repair ATPase MutS
MKMILETIYLLDVYLAVSSIGRAKGFCYGEALPKEDNVFVAGNLRHPCLDRAVGNAVSMNNGNVIFLTGANMAGKSTFMKSFAIAVYLAHMGFPVAAQDLKFSVKDGLYTSINVPDDLSMGYSHFYAEVLRVKKVAEEICRPLELVIIFDELFKGTNVKDAYDATLAITSAFADKLNCFFVISTHITEAGIELRKNFTNLQFVYFPSILNGKVPVYTYQLQEGISNDRHGMVILRKEGVLEILER